MGGAGRASASFTFNHKKCGRPLIISDSSNCINCSTLYRPLIILDSSNCTVAIFNTGRHIILNCSNSTEAIAVVKVHCNVAADVSDIGYVDKMLMAE